MNLIGCLLLLTAVSFCTADHNGPQADFSRTSPEMIRARGFECEEHEVRTQDGYILTLHRIKNPAVAAGTLKKRRTVLLQHGLMDTSATFLMSTDSGYTKEAIEDNDDYLTSGDHSKVNSNLGFELAKRGYDVWLGNSRGNVYSRKHATLKTSSAAFWDFSFDEMSAFDLPAVIDYILRKTGSENIGYVGHSQGSMTVFGLLANKPEFAKKLKPVIALGPITTFNGVSIVLKAGSRFRILVRALQTMSPEFLPATWITKYIADQWCESRIPLICANVMFAANGFSAKQLHPDRIGVFSNHFPAGTSTRNIRHYAQAMSSGKARYFDFGMMKNMRLYGSIVPPEYPLSNIDPTNIVLISSKDDTLATPKDTDLLIQRLGGSSKFLGVHKITTEFWNHMDFTLGVKTGQYVNYPVLQYLAKYEPKTPEE